MWENVGQGFLPEDGLPQAVSLLKILMYVSVRFINRRLRNRGFRGVLDHRLRRLSRKLRDRLRGNPEPTRGRPTNCVVSFSVAVRFIAQIIL